MRRVFESHIHYPVDMYEAEFVSRSDAGILEKLDLLANNLVKCGVVKSCLLGGRGIVNELTADALKRYPELFIGVVYVDLDKDPAELIEDYYAKGFKGVKFICPRRDYDDEGYFGHYRAAEKCGMVALFHTGVIGNEVDYLYDSPFKESLLQKTIEFEKKLKRFQSSSRYMIPLYLDNIALKFTELKIIGAHMGYGMYDVACAVARFRRNVFFDVSGGDVIRRHLSERKIIGNEISVKKLLYGSDCVPEAVGTNIAKWEYELERYGLDENGIDDIMYMNAARIYGTEKMEP